MRTDPGRDDKKDIEVRRIDLNPKKEEVLTGRKHNMELSIAAWIFVLLFALLIGRVVFINVFESESLRNNINNTKADSNSENVIRGDIRTLDGTVLATTLVDENGNQTRSYPFDNVFAHVVGYASNGKAGLEAEENYDLLSSHSSLIKQIRAEETGEKVQGDHVIVTLDEKLQQTAYYALGSYSGAVVVMEPDSGRILAMVSKPDFNPNAIGMEWENLVADSSSSVLLNRATQGLYPPGSTFKMITSLAYLRAHPTDYSSFMWNCEGALSEDDVRITCYGDQVHGMEDLASAFSNSCNTAFAHIGLELDNSEFKKTAEDFLFNHSLPTAMQHSQSVFKLTKDSSAGEQMTTAIGQGDTLVTPLHMALVTSAIANGGIMMRPYYVDHIETNDGTVVKQYDPEIYKKVLTPDEAGILTEYMKKTAESGTAAALSGNGYTVAGKTGSAEYEKDGVTGTHSWFCGFAQTTEPHIAIAVIAEDGGTGSSTAVPIAKQILDTFFYG
ncbi:MAG: penicillin-binding protein 2 [Lachnospiraceae bacterium]|nr:penicillin-binding protein 2 [Lachnospiraceae bacterium]